MSGQSDDDAKTDAGRPPRRSERTCRNVQRLASENESLRSQSTVGAVRTVTMANEVARLNKPIAFSGAEDEYSDCELCADVLRGYDGRHAAADPRVKRTPTDEAGKERAARSTISWHC